MVKKHPLRQRVPLIQRFPHDVLVEIFLLCLPGLHGTPCRSRGSLSTRVAPLQVCSVCSSWRSAALSAPRLWARLRLEPPYAKPKIVTECIHTWFGRARAFPLSIRFEFRRSPGTRNSSSVGRRILTTLSQYTSRWEFVELNLQGIPSYKPLKEPIEASFLRTFRAAWNGAHIIHFSSAPRLTEIRLSQFNYRPTAIQSIPWHQLTALSIASALSLSTALEFMRCCQRLENLAINIQQVGGRRYDMAYYYRSDVVYKPPIDIANLRTFTLTSLQDVRPLLQSLVLPALVDFSLEYGKKFVGHGWGIYCNELVNLFNRSKCKLQLLRLGNWGLTPDQAIKLVHHDSLTTLASLSITNDSDIRTFNNDVLIQLSASEVLPDLSELVLERCFDYGLTPGFLGRMVWSRCDRKAEKQSLKFFSATTTIRLQESDKAFLRKVEASGVAVALYGYDDVMVTLEP